MHNRIVNKTIQLSILDPQNPSSLINTCNDELRGVILDIPEERFHIPKAELREEIKPTPLCDCLRFSFWREHGKIQAEITTVGITRKFTPGRKITARDIYSDLCTKEFFYKNYFFRPDKFLWILQPTMLGEKQFHALQERSFERLWEVLEICIHRKDKDGNLLQHQRNMENLTRTIRYIQERTLGSIALPIKSINIKATKAEYRKDEWKEIKKEVDIEKKQSHVIDDMDKVKKKKKQLKEMMNETRKLRKKTYLDSKDIKAKDDAEVWKYDKDDTVRSGDI